jgi:hypothetical protein
MSELELYRAKTFRRLVFITRDDLLAARWWHEGMAAISSAAPSRRAALKVLLGLGGALGTYFLLREGCQALRGADITMDSLELQRKEGWAVGAQGKPLLIPDGVAQDAEGNASWAATLARLADDLAPGASLWEPYYVRTLFEVFGNPRGAGLAPIIRPMRNLAMEIAEPAARAVAALFAEDEDRKRTALVLDMPGPVSVAAAAGVARLFAPVFLYDNWPHPLGVVPSQLTLAAAIYHRPNLVAARAQRAALPAPAFVLDSDRLAPYRDEPDRFDNRYLARLPNADSLAALHIERVLYVTATPQAHELDDLNDDFVLWRRQGIDVKLLALSDFTPAPPSLLAASHLPNTDPTYYYGGHPLGRAFFWSSYGWHSPSYAGRTWSGGALPRHVSAGGSFAPAPRPTMFSSRTVGGLAGVGKQKPSGFGRVSYRSGSTGSSFGRSGSFGRSSFGSSG